MRGAELSLSASDASSSARLRRARLRRGTQTACSAKPERVTVAVLDVPGADGIELSPAALMLATRVEERGRAFSLSASAGNPQCEAPLSLVAITCGRSVALFVTEGIRMLCESLLRTESISCLCLGRRSELPLLCVAGLAVHGLALHVGYLISEAKASGGCCS